MNGSSVLGSFCGVTARVALAAAAVVALTTAPRPLQAEPAAADPLDGRRVGVAIDILQLAATTGRFRVDYAFHPRSHAALILGAGSPDRDWFDDYRLYEVGGQVGLVLLGDRRAGVGALGQVLGRVGSGERDPEVGENIRAEGSAFLAHLGVFGRWGSRFSGLFLEASAMIGYARLRGHAEQGGHLLPTAVDHLDSRASLYLGAQF